MWRCKLLLPALFFFVGAFAQTDSAYFVRHANTLDDLFPTFLFTVHLPDGPADSSFVVRKDAQKQLRADLLLIGGKDTFAGQLEFRWNKAGHLEKYRGLQNGVVKEQRDYVYVRGKQLTSLTIHEAKRTDTLSFSWNRAGLISGEYYSIHHGKRDTVLRMEKLYDGQRRLIVATTAAYGPSVYGAFTFEYDKEGRLVRRCFLVRNGGAVLCTDTLIYSFADSLKTVLRTSHLIRIAGFSEWIPIDGKEENAITHALRKYWLERGPENNHAYDVPVNYVGWWEYTPEGRVESKLVALIDGPHGEHSWYTQYYYNPSGQCDSIRTVESTYDGKDAEDVYTSLTTFAYDPATGLPVLRKEVSYISFNQGRKKKWRLESASEMRYEWK